MHWTTAIVFTSFFVLINCPKVSYRYIPGEPATSGKWPWTAKVKSWRRCSGSIISENWVLTAGHCLTDNPTTHSVDLDWLRVILGYSEVDKKDFVKMKASQVHTYPEYKGIDDGYKYDMALIKLDQPVDFSKQASIKPACLYLDPVDFAGLKCVGVGYGLTISNKSVTSIRETLEQPQDYPERPQQMDLEVYDFNECAEQHKKFHNEEPVPERVMNTHVCMVSVEKMKDSNGSSSGSSMPGDSGGPLNCFIDDNWFQVGVCWSGPDPILYPSVYNRLDHYAEWILDLTGYQLPSRCEKSHSK